MSLARYLKSQCRSRAAAVARWRVGRVPPSAELRPATWERSVREPTDFYFDAVRFFSHILPEEFQRHRAYFQQNQRGFGEDAFHTMWYLLLEEFKPSNFLEIGVFRGQVISLVALWAQWRRRPCEVFGISPFSAAGDSVSKYSNRIDYREDTLANFKHFNLPAPHLLQAYSTDPEAVRFISSRNWDMIYIDGNHDYDVVARDWSLCSQQLKPGGIIALDDAGLTTSFPPPLFASAGHPGPSRVAAEIDRARFREILQAGHNRVFQKIA